MNNNHNNHFHSENKKLSSKIIKPITLKNAVKSEELFEILISQKLNLTLK